MKHESSFIILLSLFCLGRDEKQLNFRFPHGHVITSKLNSNRSTKHIIPHRYRLSSNAHFFLGGLIVWVTWNDPWVRSKWWSCAPNINLCFVLQLIFSHAVRWLKLTSWRYCYWEHCLEISTIVLKFWSQWPHVNLNKESIIHNKPPGLKFLVWNKAGIASTRVLFWYWAREILQPGVRFEMHHNVFAFI